MKQTSELTAKIQKLKALTAETATLQAQIANQRTEELAGLPAVYGFETVDAFIKAIKAASKASPRKRTSQTQKARRPKAEKQTRRPGRPKASTRRARITDEVKAKVGILVNEGKTGEAIAKLLGISLPSVGNIKKALGLVKARLGRKPGRKAQSPTPSPIQAAAAVPEASAVVPNATPVAPTA